MIELDKIIFKVEMLEKDKENSQKKVETLKSSLELKQQVRNFLIAFSEYSRNLIKEKLENLVNSALKCVFSDKRLVFKIIANRTKRGLFYDLYVETDGTLTPLFDAKGGGVLDIISIALRISFLRMFSGSLRQVMILDEPFKNLDAERVKIAIEWLKLVSKDFCIQFIIVTHIEGLIESADKAYRFKIEDGKTVIE